MKHIISIMILTAATIVVVAPSAPFITVAPANAGEKECNDRCFEKFSRCKKEGHACVDDKLECEKDCKANAK